LTESMMSTATVRAQTPAEELANAISHGLGLALAIAALPLLVVFANQHGSAADITAAALFGASMVLLYGISTLYHALPAGAAKRWFNRLDHAAIYVFIAGSYTPFVLGPLRGGWGWSLFGVVWTLAVVGVALKLFNGSEAPGLVHRAVRGDGLGGAGGHRAAGAAHAGSRRWPGWWRAALAYTLGAAVYLLDNRLRFAHLAFHLFVMAGSACHVVAAMTQFA
jgi:hemolysin III